jgi:uncharacterized membrane-anchored protein YhcB (DUF1043 family)
LMYLTSLHGIHLLEEGEAYIFPESFEQILWFKIPIHVDLPATMDLKECMQHFVGTMIATPVMSSRLQKFCADIYFEYEEFYNKTLELLLEAHTDFENRFLTRRKRFIVSLIAGGVAGAVTGAVTGAITGYIAAKAVTARLESKIGEMENQMENQNKKFVVIEDQLMGMSEIMNENFKQVRQHFKLVTNNLQVQVNSLKNTFETVISNMESSIHELFYKIEVDKYLAYHMNALQTTFTLEMNKIKYWESVFIDLNEGKLPRNLINMIDLKAILSEIQRQLMGKFEFAIGEDDWNLYYTIPMASYATKLV